MGAQKHSFPNEDRPRPAVPHCSVVKCLPQHELIWENTHHRCNRRTCVSLIRISLCVYLAVFLGPPAHTPFWDFTTSLISWGCCSGRGSDWCGSEIPCFIQSCLEFSLLLRLLFILVSGASAHRISDTPGLSEQWGLANMRPLRYYIGRRFY